MTSPRKTGSRLLRKRYRRDNTDSRTYVIESVSGVKQFLPLQAAHQVHNLAARIYVERLREGTKTKPASAGEYRVQGRDGYVGTAAH